MPSPRAPDLGLVLACYNESQHFTDSASQILRTLDRTRWSYEIIFVDDCSQDTTRDLIDAFIAAHPQHQLRRVFHERNSGRGGAVSDGFRLSQAPIVGYIDIDLETHCRYIPACVEEIEAGADVAVAWRVYKFYVRSVDRYILSQGYHWLSQRLLNVPLQDTETGFKFFRRERLMPLLDEIEDQRWFWDTEVMVRAYHKGYRIVEVPALFLRRFDKRSTVNSLQDSLTYLQRLWRFRKALRRR